jgi:hypothetical protein
MLVAQVEDEMQMLRKYKARHLGGSPCNMQLEAWDRLFYMRIAQVRRASTQLGCPLIAMFSVCCSKITVHPRMCGIEAGGRCHSLIMHKKPVSECAEGGVPLRLHSCGVALQCARLHTVLQGTFKNHHGHSDHCATLGARSAPKVLSTASDASMMSK